MEKNPDKVGLNVSPFGITCDCRVLDCRSEEVSFDSKDGSKRNLTRWDLFLDSSFGQIVSSVYSERDFVFEKGKIYRLSLMKFDQKRGSAPSFGFALA